MVEKVTHWHICITCKSLKMPINSFKCPYPSYPVLKIGNVLPSSKEYMT